MPETLLDVMVALYRSEINCGMQSFWDGGFDVWLGDELNEIKACRRFDVDELEEAPGWLCTEACKAFPGSTFALACGATPPK